MHPKAKLQNAPTLPETETTVVFVYFW